MSNFASQFNREFEKARRRQRFLKRMEAKHRFKAAIFRDNYRHFTE